MKKMISILLVIMLILGMLPATTLTAFAADTYEKATSIAVGDTVVLVYETNKMELDSISTTSTKYGIGKVYTDAPKGLMPLIVEQGSQAGTFAFKMADGKYLNWSSGNSLSTATSISKNSSWTVTFSDGNAEILNAANNTRSLQWNSGSPRFACYTSSQQAIQLYKLSGGTTPDPEPSCTHENTTLTGVVDAECGKPGYTGDYVCDDCGETTQKGSATEALTHSYVDGTCEHCGEPEPVAPEIPTDGYYKQVTALSDVTAGGQFVIVAASDGNNYALSLTTSSGKPAGVKVTVVGDSIVADDISTLPGWVIVPVDGGIALQNGDKYLSYGSSGTDFGVSSTSYTWSVEDGIHINATTGNNRAVMYRVSVNAFGGYSTSNATNVDYVYDLKLYKLVEGEAEVVNSTLTFVEQGTTTKTETAEATTSYTMPAATNAAPTGYTFAGWVEEQLLEETAIAPETVYAAGSSYTVGNDATFYALYTRTEVQEGEGITAYVAKDISEINDGDVVVITMTNATATYALPNNGGASSPKANVTVTTNADGQLVADFENILWDLEKDGDNLVFYVHGSTEDWLYCLANDNSGVRVGNGDAKVFVVDAATGYLMNTQTTADRYIGVYNNQDWRCYKLNNDNIASNIANQILTFYVATTISGTIETTYYTTCVHSYASVSATAVACAYCGAEKAAPVNVNGTAYETIEAAAATGKTVILNQNVENAVVSGELKLDLNGKAATNVTATKIYAADSSATATTKGRGSLTTTSEVVMDNTMDGVRYIALQDTITKTYTFHVLEMKLSAVSLRTTAAGIYYKAIVNCDDTLAGSVSQYGIALSTRNMPGADFATENEVNGWTVVQGNITSGQAFTSGSVFGIFKDDESRVAAAAERNVTLDELNALYGEVEIYANAYIVVGGTTIMADTTNAGKTNGVAWSLKEVLVTLDSSTTLTDAQKTQIRDFYDHWRVKDFGWNLDNIASWSPSSAS